MPDENKTVLVVGLGEVGRPLLNILSAAFDCVGVDVEPPDQSIEDVAVMHICYPYQVDDFVGTTARYIEHFTPDITVINSTVAVGTTRAIAENTGADVVHSPVRGKHARMQQDMMRYAKFVGGLSVTAATKAAGHFEAAGFCVRIASSPESTELAKLAETTYFGVLIAWAQELERYCDRFATSYDEVTSIFEEVDFFPRTKYFPGVIGGHCVMPNIAILRELADSQLLDAVVASNWAKMERDASVRPSTAAEDNDVRVARVSTL